MDGEGAVNVGPVPSTGDIRWSAASATRLCPGWSAPWPSWAPH